MFVKMKKNKYYKLKIIQTTYNPRLNIFPPWSIHLIYDNYF